MVTRRRILIIDDDPILKYLLRSELESAGYDVIEVRSGNQGLEIREQPDLILMDVGLPGLDGFQTTPRIRRMFPSGRFPIVYATAFDRRQVETRGAEAGGDLYALKPFDVEDLVADINTLFASPDPLAAQPDEQFRVLCRIQRPPYVAGPDA